MATSVENQPAVHMLALDQIKVDRNIRHQLVADEIDQLAQSIALLGQLTPVSVREDPETGGYVMIAGHKRHAALVQLGATDIRAEIRTGDEREAAERAAENIVRTQLNPHEEALAVKAMLDRGLTIDGVAQALGGWSRARVTARTKLLELPDTAQQMVGDGQIPLSAVDHLLAIGRVSAPLLDTVIAYIADGNAWVAERLAREPGWVLDSALRSGRSDVFAEDLGHVNAYQLRELKLGKKADANLERAGELARQLDRYNPSPHIEFDEQDIDQARAAGVLIEFEDARAHPVIVDRRLYRELCKQALARTVTELEDKLARREAQRTADRQVARDAGATEPDPLRDLEREHRRRLREIAEDAHGANRDLGASLLSGLATVDPNDINVARFFVYALLGPDWNHNPYGERGNRVYELAVSGIRLVIDSFREDVTKTRKDGTRGALRISYGDPHQAECAEPPIAWVWKFIDGAKTASELYGRALVVIAAEQYASRKVVPSSQQTRTTSWHSHNDKAAKALAKLAGPHLPASLKAIERAVTRADREHDQTIMRIREHRPADADRGPGDAVEDESSDAVEEDA